MELLFALFLGLAIGSFLNVLIVRIPKGENIAFPPSHCPKCDNALKWWHNIPLLSWIFLQGKCAYCKSPISRLYPVVELLTGLVFMTLAMKLGVGVEWFVTGLIFSLLLALSIIDFKYYAVPDSLNFTALALALLMPIFTFGGDWMTDGVKDFSLYQDALLESFKNAAIMGSSFFLLGLAVKFLIKKDALGEADIIIAATMGALLGFPLVLIAIYVSALLAIVPALFARGHMVPFVPFLALGTWIVYIFSDTFLKWWNMLYA
ncbi:prepilin peptidase [Hydrogenimonas cancrithermarum]|uniref:Type 4 prepilin-like proteins leader peptide-processing enzyme n=1 Tax=Hydrogenimonas cancrithermarum TaxID=2993563 RepID=A0ABM8FIV5_9BACT|nr:A24 family peptidase [Hydrogenimonas cancrithermarum]BDY12216.1 type 4 prepilin-like proteins leader peptide-processing enzyme [Hydrogenimonas cancrithermarum]